VHGFFSHHHFEFFSNILSRLRLMSGVGVLSPLDQLQQRVGSSIRRDYGVATMDRETQGHETRPGGPGMTQRTTGVVEPKEPTRPDTAARYSGALIMNADDWGRTREITERTLHCVRRGTVSSVSAMVFLEDSVRAAAIARESKIDAGLHLNFTMPFSAADCPPQLAERQNKIASYLLRHRLAQVIYHPGLKQSFEYVVSAQIDEFRRLYGKDPDRLDGHHHMHLCANMLLGNLLPPGTMVRRSFSFAAGQKPYVNRLYRYVVDRRLAKRHRMVDLFFSLAPVTPDDRVDYIFSLSREFVVELETHPVNPEEYRLLMSDEIFRRLGDIRIVPSSSVSPTQK